MRLGSALALAAAAALSACTPRPTDGGHKGLAIVGGTVFDGSDAPPLVDAFVVVEGERIKAIGPQSHVPLPKGVPVVDARGKFVVPYSEPYSEPARASGESGRGSDAAAQAVSTWQAAGARLAVGGPANLQVLDADPRLDVANLSRIHATIRGGRLEPGPGARP